MEAKATKDILESYIFCKYKSYLKLVGQKGDKSDYERMLTSLRDEVRRKAIEKIRRQNQQDQVLSDIVLSTSVLDQAPRFILGAIIENDLVSVSLGGLKKIPGRSKFGQFTYAPVLFHAGNHIHKEQRLLLELYALFLSEYHGMAPSSGIIWHGRDCKASSVRLSPEPQKAK